MKLKFYARGRAMVADPARPAHTGQMPSYVGRSWDAEKRQHPPTKEAYECDEGSRVAQRCAKHVRQGDLWPANAEAAVACGVPFPSLDFQDGEWSLKVEPKSASNKKGDA